MTAFRDGTKNDPANAENYAGLDTAMSSERRARKGTRGRTGALSGGRQRNRLGMPANLVYQLALARAEAGQFEQALALFQGRFFPSEEGGVSAGQVMSEIKLMQAEANAE